MIPRFPSRIPINRNKNKRKPKQSESKCRIVTKKKKDGSVVKEISGVCTKDQIRALQDNSSDID